MLIFVTAPCSSRFLAGSGEGVPDGIALHDASYDGVLPQCRAVRVRPPLPGVQTPCVASRDILRSGNGWTVRIAFRVPAGTQDPKALG
jgi:hypothetical protein